MRYLIALLLPWISFFTIGQPVAGVICLVLQITLIGWPIAALWALFSVNNFHAEKRAERIIHGALHQHRNVDQ